MNTITTDTPPMKDFFLSQFNSIEKDFLFEERKAAINHFAEIGFPTKKNEDWKYTDITPILKENYKLQIESPLECLLKTVQVPKGVVIQNFSEIQKEQQEIIKKNFAETNLLNDGFSILNKAFANDGFFIFIPENTIIDEPLELNFFQQADENAVFHLRNLIVVGKNSKVTVIEKYFSTQENTQTKYLKNSVTEMFLGENSSADYYRIVNEEHHSYHIGNIHVHQEKRSKFSSNMITLNGAIVRNNLNVMLAGECCETILNGLYIAKGNQLVDNHTFVDHAKPNCYSNEFYKGIISEKATAVFNGKVLVRKDAQKTNAFQSNKNILLSDEASVNSKPQLEIFADDVKCSHGATTGQMDKEALFYLQARGIDKEAAKTLLVQAFANEIIEKIKIDSLKEHLQGIIQR